MFYAVNCSISTVPVRAFYVCRVLKYIDLSYNNISFLDRDVFRYLHKLDVVILRNNQLQTTGQVFSLSGDFNTFILSDIDLSVMQIRYLPDNAFSACLQLRNINLSFNPLLELPAEVFSQSQEYFYIDLRDVTLQTMHSTNIYSTNHIEVIAGDIHELCCISKFISQCLVKQTTISSCEYLISPLILQFFIWINGITVLVLNVSVVFYRLSNKKTYKKWSSYINIYMINMAMADAMMGLYLLGIAATNTRYRLIYGAVSRTWRASNMCKILSVLSTVSAEVSLLSLTASIYFQFRTIQHIYGSLSHIKALVTLSLVIIWSCMAILAIIPIVDLEYFGGDFASPSGTCLLYPFTSNATKSNEYAIAIWLVGNVLILIAISTIEIGLAMKIQQSRSRVSGQRSMRAANSYRLFVLFVVVVILCWTPVLITQLLVHVAVHVSEVTAEYVVVMLLPLNALVNPFLYTARTMSFK